MVMFKNDSIPWDLSPLKKPPFGDGVFFFQPTTEQANLYKYDMLLGLFWKNQFLPILTLQTPEQNPAPMWQNRS